MVTTLSTSGSDEIAKYHHQSLGSAPTSAILRVLTKHPRELMTFPGMARDLITKHLPPSTATAKGHMTRTRQGLRSTRSMTQEIMDARAQVDDMAPMEQVCSAIDDEMFCFSVTTEYEGNVIYSDLPGRFPSNHMLA